MRKSLAIPALVIALAVPAAAQTGEVIMGSQPGAAGAAHKMHVQATIVAIDKATRSITLKGPQGHEITVVAGPEVTRFDQLKAGDKVDVDYAEALVVELRKGGGMAVARTEKSGAIKAGETAPPGAMAGKKVTVVGDVIAVDAATQTVTVKGPKRTIELPIRNPEQFRRIANGDQLEATYVEAVAVSVAPQK